MYNKRKFNKINDKKVLHKVKKQWVTISLALLMMIGGGAVATRINASADANNNQSQQQVQTSIQLGSKKGNNNITNKAKALHRNLLSKANVNKSSNNKQINTNDRGDLVTVNNKPVKKVNNVNRIGMHKANLYHGYVYNRIDKPFQNLRTNHTIALHSSINLNHDHIFGYLHPGKIVKTNRMFKQFGHHGNYLRYEINLANKRTAFITGNNHYVSYVIPARNYKYYQNKASKLLKNANYKNAKKISNKLYKLNKQRNHNFHKYANLYEMAFNAQQNHKYSVVVNYNSKQIASDTQISNNFDDTLNTNEQPIQNNTAPSSAFDTLIPTPAVASATSTPINNTGSAASTSSSSVASSASASTSTSAQSMSSSEAISMSNNMTSLESNMDSRMASMTPEANSLNQQKPQASNDYRAFQSYSNDALAESKTYEINSNLAQSYLNDTNNEKASASSENTSYLAAKNSSSISSLGNQILSNISYASSNAHLAYSAASVANSNLNQEMSNISYANNEYINMQQNIFDAPKSSASTPNTVASDNSNNSKEPVSLKLGSTQGFNINTLDKQELEQLYFSELKNTNDVEAKVQQLRDSHYYHNEELYDTTFANVVPTNNSSDNHNNSSNKQMITLTPEPLVPKQDNFVTSDLNFNNGKSLPVQITSPLKGNNDGLAGQYSNGSDTGGIQATLYPNGTFLMSGGEEEDGFFTPATMKIGQQQNNSDNNNSDNSDNSDYSDNSDNSDTSDNSDGVPFSKYNKDVVSENFSDVRVTGNMWAQFAEQPQMRFFHIKNSNFDNTYKYSDFFKGDNNLQSIQIENTTGIEGGPNSSDANMTSLDNQNSDSDNSSDDNNWDLVDPSDWVDTKTGDTNSNDIINGDVWINTKNSPIYHIFSIPVEANIQNNDGSITKRQEYATIKGLVGNSTIINLSQLNLPGYTNISSGNAAVAFNFNNNQFYYTNNGDTKNWTNTNNIDPTLIVDFKPNSNETKLVLTVYLPKSTFVKNIADVVEDFASGVKSIKTLGSNMAEDMFKDQGVKKFFKAMFQTVKKATKSPTTPLTSSENEYIKVFANLINTFGAGSISLGESTDKLISDIKDYLKNEVWTFNWYSNPKMNILSDNMSDTHFAVHPTSSDYWVVPGIMYRKLVDLYSNAANDVTGTGLDFLADDFTGGLLSLSELVPFVQKMANHVENLAGSVLNAQLTGYRDLMDAKYSNNNKYYYTKSGIGLITGLDDSVPVDVATKIENEAKEAVDHVTNA